jgi:general secretion pathway protein C
MGGRARVFERSDQRRAPIREPISGDPILSGGDAILPASLLGPGRIVNPTRIAIWAVNAALFVLCCWLAAGLVNTAIGEWLAGPPTETVARAPVAPPPTREWSDRQTILERNLFQVSTLLPEGPVDAEPEPSEEELEATRLPLRLLGTAANTDGGPSWAAVEDQQNHKQIVVREQDKLLEQATVVRIERRRIVLQNGGKREELALDEEEPGAIKVSARPAARTAPPPAPNDLRDRIRRLSETSFEVGREQVEETMRNPAELFSEARILPKYDNGQMVGVQLSSIKPGSLFEEIGIQNGDTVTGVNGITVTSPQDSAALLKELTESTDFQVNVMGADGQIRTLQYTIGQ